MRLIDKLRATLRVSKPKAEAERARLHQQWIDAQYKEITKWCLAECEEGKSHILVGYEVYPEVIEALKAEGLSVSKSTTGRHMTTTRISWEE